MRRFRNANGILYKIQVNMGNEDCIGTFTINFEMTGKAHVTVTKATPFKLTYERTCDLVLPTVLQNAPPPVVIEFTLPHTTTP